MDWLVGMTDELQALAYLITVLSAPAATIQLIRSKRSERKAREDATYDALDVRFAEFLQVCLEHPDLPLFDGANRDSVPLTAEQQYRMEIAFSMLTSILERAYLMYRGQSDAFRVAQWQGWEAYIDHYLAYSPYLRFWLEAGEQFDRDFFGFVEKKRKALQVAAGAFVKEA